MEFSKTVPQTRLRFEGPSTANCRPAASASPPVAKHRIDEREGVCSPRSPLCAERNFSTELIAARVNIGFNGKRKRLLEHACSVCYTSASKGTTSEWVTAIMRRRNFTVSEDTRNTPTPRRTMKNPAQQQLETCTCFEGEKNKNK